MTRPLLDFDDAGASDDHPAKGVTVGDIRAWFDEIERLTAEVASLKASCGYEAANQLTADNGRLRAALKQMVEDSYLYSGSQLNSTLAQASAALKDTTP